MYFHNQELKRKVLAKFDLERIAKEVNMYVDGLVEFGHGGDRETGILQDDEVIENIETNQEGNDSNGPHRRR